MFWKLSRVFEITIKNMWIIQVNYSKIFYIYICIYIYGTLCHSNVHHYVSKMPSSIYKFSTIIIFYSSVFFPCYHLHIAVGKSCLQRSIQVSLPCIRETAFVTFLHAMWRFHEYHVLMNWLCTHKQTTFKHVLKLHSKP